MRVKDVIISSLKILGRAELAASLSSGNVSAGEETETVNTLLYCFNAVEDEVARHYMPLILTEEIISPDNKFYFSAFSRPPVKIRSVTADGEAIAYSVQARYLLVDTLRITVEYQYAPLKKTLEGNSDFGEETGEYLLALGVAAEYCFINGETEAGELWEKKYRREIDNVSKSLPSCGKIPPRRWV